MAKRKKTIRPTALISHKNKPSLNAIGRSRRWQQDGWVRVYAALGNSLAGFRAVFVSEQAFRWGIYIGAIFFFGLLVVNHYIDFELDKNIWLFLFIGYFILLAFELINSGIEILCDMVEPRYHRLIKAVKDMGSAAVFLCYAFNAIIWLVLVVLPLVEFFLDH
ncbi:MAG: diacylglycerol kinase [Alphaproteobacteria bacterium]